MTQLVLHTGTPSTRVRDVQASLAAWSDALAEAGVVTLPADRIDSWDRTVQQVVAGEVPPPVRKLVRQSANSGAHTIVLSSEEAYRPLRKGKNLAQFAELATSAGATPKVVLTLREQLDMVNSAYCRQVAGLETSEPFESYARKTIDSGVYNYARTFRALLDSDEIAFAPIPFSRLDAEEPARSVLREAGVPDELVRALPRLEANDPLRDDGDVEIGPLLLAATRLLHKRLVRLELTTTRKPQALQRTARRLANRAQEGGWDDRAFWGWTPERAAETSKAFRHSNAEFAAGAWRSDWPDPPHDRPQAVIDIADVSPALVVEVMDAVQLTVSELMSRHLAAAERL
jgi:hypothetical protein